MPGPTPHERDHPPFSWTLIAVPLLAVALANADVVVLLLVSPQSWGPRLASVLGLTFALSVLSGLWALWLLVRARREMQRRASAERSMREALGQTERALQHESALRRELDHRVRNNLAGLSGLIGLYERSGRPAAQVSLALKGKVRAMKEVHDIINRAGGGPVDLRTVITSVADAIITGSRRAAILVSGPRVPLTTGEASAVAMVVQELLTNSSKYGALGTAGGSVGVSWSACASPTGVTLRLDWCESPVGPPEPAAPGERAAPTSGVGLPLIEGFARSDLRGDVKFERGPDSWFVRLTAELEAPVSMIEPDHSLTEIAA